jgi:serine/threonine protein kinase|tara:strand:- start:489 stop:800 length:312 start_codon:yes stop_codon:yes gene_type:complete
MMTKEKKKEARPIIRSSESGTVRRIKQYTLLTRLGQGSFAEVFLAKSDVDETYCAAKVFDKSLLRRKRTISRTVEGFKIHSELDKARPHLRLDDSQHCPGNSG